MIQNEKLKKLENHLKELGSVAIAFSGGVDSTFLAKVAVNVLKDKAVAFTAVSSSYPERERQEGMALAKQIGIRHVFFDSEETDIVEFTRNPPDRCYYCKKELFTKLIDLARQYKLQSILDGSNADDIGDFRPGLKALNELQIESPLKEAGLTKDDIRALSRELGLPTWNKPAFACLSSRFQYGDAITREKLKRVEQAEDFLRTLGLKVLRVRDHGNQVRIETSEQEFNIFLNKPSRQKIIKKLKSLGYHFISLDLEGYRTGSMNEVLK